MRASGAYPCFIAHCLEPLARRFSRFPASGPVTVQEDLVHLAFEVDNLDDTIRALNDKQIKITDGPTRTSSGSRFIFIDAPDGYEIELIERPPGTAIV